MRTTKTEITGGQEMLAYYAQKIVALQNVRDGISADIREFKSAAKSSGFDATLLSKAIKVVKEPSVYKEEQALIELYSSALKEVGIDFEAGKGLNENAE